MASRSSMGQKSLREHLIADFATLGEITVQRYICVRRYSMRYVGIGTRFEQLVHWDLMSHECQDVRSRAI